MLNKKRKQFFLLELGLFLFCIVFAFFMHNTITTAYQQVIYEREGTFLKAL